MAVWIARPASIARDGPSKVASSPSPVVLMSRPPALLTAAEAHGLLVEFLHQCIRRGRRCVRIIHGKGLRSKNREPVLKTKVANWLIQRDEVLAFCQARQVDGGSGAVVVLLKA